LINNEEMKLKTPIAIKNEETNKIELKFSIYTPVIAAATEELRVMIAEPRPEALPAREGTALTISAFEAGQIIPEPKVIIKIGK
jgi:hypothetical protein